MIDLEIGYGRFPLYFQREIGNSTSVKVGLRFVGLTLMIAMSNSCPINIVAAQGSIVLQRELPRMLRKHVCCIVA